MKLIITESKRNKVVTKWLNKYYNNLFIKEYPRWGVMDFFTTDEPKSKVFVYESGVLLIINPNLIDELNNIFNVDEDDLNDIFIPFMKNNYNLKVILVKYY
jgi:hypothetical protein